MSLLSAAVISASLREFSSPQHLRSAALFARKAHGIELRYIGYDETLISEHKSYVTAVIFFTVAFIEATINELFADASEPSGGIAAPLGRGKVEALKREWQNSCARTLKLADALAKYQKVIGLAGAAPLQLGKSPAQDVKLLITIRNYLIHAEPEWLSAELQHKDLDATVHAWTPALRGRFPLNPLRGGGNPFFPDQVLGYGCAVWAISKSVEFVNDFYSRLNLQGRHESVVEGLTLTLGNE